MKKIISLMFAATLIICGQSMLTSCSSDNDDTIVNPQPKTYFTLWNQCEALTALQEYVQDVTLPAL